MQFKVAKVPAPVCEYRFHPKRKWRFDYAWPEKSLALEEEGGIYIQGRHTRPKGFENDIEKYNEAAVLGWTVIRCTRKHIDNGQALEWVQELLR
jgi:hypothetical protein